MALLSLILGVVGNATAILVLLSPMPTFWRIIKQKNAGSFSPQPYLFGLLSGMFWTYYGILKEGGIFVITISVTSCAFQLFYLSLYVWFANRSQRKKATGILLVIVTIYVTTIVSTMKLEHGNAPLITFGVLCVVTSVFSNAAPLTVMGKVIRTKSVQYMPFTLSLGLFLNGASWLSYALSVKDTFLMIPNAIGTSLAAVQLALYTFYKFYGVQTIVLNKSVDLTSKGKQCDSLEDIQIMAMENSGNKLAATYGTSSVVEAVFQEIKLP